MLIRFIQRNQGHRDLVMHEFSSNVNKVNKAIAKVRTIGDRLPLKKEGIFPLFYECRCDTVRHQTKWTKIDIHGWLIKQSKKV